MPPTAIHLDIAEQPTPRMLEHDRRMAMWREEPLLALAFWVEAAADRRIENDQHALALLTDARDRAREAVARHTGRPFRNELYPVKS